MPCSVQTMRASSVAWRGRGWKSHVPFTCSAQPPELHPLITRHRASGAPASPHAPSTHRLSAPRHPRVAVGALLGDQSVQDDLAHANNVAKVPPSHIRNFCIIAHIDHGKSTLADQLLLATHSVAQRDMQAQYLDGMDLERERGITIKLCAARMRYRGAADGQQYALNLIDTPGHVDFAYEVSRSLAACEGCLLVVDASQGVEAQTLANVYLALESDLTIIPVLNKIDLPGADVERVRQEITDVVGLDASDALLVSAKQGIGIAEVLEAVVQRIPPPRDTRGDPLRALIFDSYYDPYKGVVAQFRVMDGELRRGDVVRFMNTRCEHPVAELGVLAPKAVEVESLHAGEVGYLAAAIKSVADARVGDTVTLKREPATEALPGYTEVKPMVFCGMFTIDADQYGGLREALTKLQLSDAALSFEPEVSSAMGFGFRCGFLGLLHLEIVQERLEREYGLDLITTAPTVVFRARTSDGAEHVVDCPSKLPPAATLSAVLEPYVRLEVITPKEYVGPILDLLQTRRGEHIEMQFMTEARTTVVYDMPLAEVVMDLFDALKSRSRGYASMEYSITGWRENDLVLLEVSINGERVEPLAAIVHRATAYNIGRALVKKLKEVIPRQQFRVPIQASIGARVLASEAIPALRKDVLAKCYGGDISRKKKLLQKQAKGKKRMKSLGKVDVPQDAFMAVLRINRTGGED
ncbi:EFG10 [Auxenochlorella protothecoides x Auxenochlorella symbiontica]|uniref:Translation factor GUF1 homolog, mitochondrial n=1 Tax=Auxenochlorella protothecoides TaxID=3075 RepID=A0A1D2AGG5_AUXPR